MRLVKKDDTESNLQNIVGIVVAELHSSTQRYGQFNSTHEAYGVIKEEVDEMWDECKKNDLIAMRDEAIQVAAMALRFILDADKSIVGC